MERADQNYGFLKNADQITIFLRTPPINTRRCSNIKRKAFDFTTNKIINQKKNTVVPFLFITKFRNKKRIGCKPTKRIHYKIKKNPF